MGSASQKIRTGKSTPQGKPTVTKGPSQTAKIVTPKKTYKAGC
jgi:hypothetical protein